MNYKNQWRIFLVVLGVFFGSGEVMAQSQPVNEIENMSGSLTGAYQLPKNAFVVVTLNDQSQQNRVIAKYQFYADDLSLPLNFQLSYFQSKIQDGHLYRIQAVVLDHGDILYWGAGAASELIAQPRVYDDQIRMVPATAAL
ncbi:YbaY family lipoprotein [Vibrio mangrovi]|nr:YbaY family lipoprotein [Vibrio mangrovi]MDW6003564.1 YbaY family lipoprotein [Vibrio mangrovi]